MVVWIILKKQSQSFTQFTAIPIFCSKIQGYRSFDKKIAKLKLKVIVSLGHALVEEILY